MHSDPVQRCKLKFTELQQQLAGANIITSSFDITVEGDAGAIPSYDENQENDLTLRLANDATQYSASRSDDVLATITETLYYVGKLYPESLSVSKTRRVTLDLTSIHLVAHNRTGW